MLRAGRWCGDTPLVQRKPRAKDTLAHPVDPINDMTLGGYQPPPRRTATHRFDHSCTLGASSPSDGALVRNPTVCILRLLGNLPGNRSMPALAPPARNLLPSTVMATPGKAARNARTASDPALLSSRDNRWLKEF